MKNLICLIVLGIFLAVPCSLWAKGKPPKDLHQKIFSSVWTRSLKPGPSAKRYFPESASPHAADGKVFAGTHSSIFYAINEADGKILWIFKSNGPIASRPIADKTSVYFGNNKGTVYALDASTGEKRWEYFVGGEILAQPALHRGSLYVVTTSREVYCLDALSGAERWNAYIKGFENKFTLRGISPVVVEGERLYIGFADGQVTALSAGNGSVIWSRDLAQGNPLFKDVDAAVLVDGGSLFVVGYFGYLAKLALNSGQVLWKKEIQSGTDIAADESNLYLSSADGQVVAFNKESGVRQWETAPHSGALSAPALMDKYVLVGAESGRVYVFNKNDGRVLQTFPISNGVWGIPSLGASRVYFLSGSGKVYSVQSTNKS